MLEIFRETEIAKTAPARSGSDAPADAISSQHDQTTAIAGRPADDAGQHARQRRAVSRKGHKKCRISLSNLPKKAKLTCADHNRAWVPTLAKKRPHNEAEMAVPT
jgi:hypothetical protein